ncbi:hypothetical protein AEAC466_20090 [Asticcacaulis sp. AC466]|uniref:hypothetical protein n=1 Tax=Asticcacaulis sp. AC466 TaxID=1282362 RepID=UPI0003C3C81E|nr:hypothetical protein [Asticcacaulis sp. AC466]ESQ81866.1 hypothetical protein AEAC466_20090 [Asticcacaulis sp. AC466]
MIGAIFAVTLLGLSDRPAVLVGETGQDYYKQKFESYLSLDGITVRRKYIFGECPDVTYRSAGYDIISDPNYHTSVDFFSKERMASKPEDVQIIVAERVDVTGCGKSHRLNFTAWHDRNNLLPNMAFSTDGTTIASQQARQDADMIAFNLVQKVRRATPTRDTCDMVPIVYNTKVEQAPKDDGRWTEIWSTAYCEVRHDVRISFTPVNGVVQVKGVVIN